MPARARARTGGTHVADKVFYSFHYKPDVQRVARIRSIGAVTGQTIDSSRFEKVKREGEAAVKRWIAREMADKDCLVVLIGSTTAGRPWVNYEIEKAWNDGLGVVGVRIHNLVDLNGNVSDKGGDPFSNFTVGPSKTPLSSIVKTYNPPGRTSQQVYNTIADNIVSWVEEAVRIRARWA
jgi:MTH538 TIR-like domain (DUF1863)